MSPWAFHSYKHSLLMYCGPAQFWAWGQINEKNRHKSLHSWYMYPSSVGPRPYGEASHSCLSRVTCYPTWPLCIDGRSNKFPPSSKNLQMGLEIFSESFSQNKYVILMVTFSGQVQNMLSNLLWWSLAGVSKGKLLIFGKQMNSFMVSTPCSKRANFLSGCWQD